MPPLSVTPMRRSLPLALIVGLLLPGCGVLGGLFGAPDLTNLEVAGRYRVSEFTVDPVSDAVRDARLLGDQVSEDLTLLLREDGTASLQRLRGEAVDATLSNATYAISGRTVTVRFDDERALGELYLPREVAFEGGNRQLRAEVFRERFDLESISNEYRGLTRADVRIRLRFQEIG